ncbi:MAG: MerR family transcriptional regulator [Acidimicrobiales bacterium]
MPEAGDDRQYRIDELARAAGTTVRNVRAYQDRGLIPAPRREGRVGLYADAHLARLRLIAALLERGYTLANIAELLAAWERGQDLGALLGFENALAAPWSQEHVTTLSAGDLVGMLGPGGEGSGPGGDGGPDPSVVEQAVAIGLLEPDGDRFRVTNPSALEVGAILARAGVPLEAILAVGAGMHDDIDRVALRFVDLVDTHVFGPRSEPPAARDVPELAALVDRLRPLTTQVVGTELARAMERHIRQRFGAHLERFAGTLGGTGADTGGPGGGDRGRRLTTGSDA